MEIELQIVALCELFKPIITLDQRCDRLTQSTLRSMVVQRGDNLDLAIVARSALPANLRTPNKPI